MRSGEARECTLRLYLPSQTRLCDIWHRTFDIGRLLAFYGHEIAGSPCLKVVHAQSSAEGYTAQFKILRNIVRTRYACRVISHMFTQLGPYGARRRPENFMWPRHKISNAYVACMRPTGLPSSYDFGSHRSLWSMGSPYKICLLRCNCHIQYGANTGPVEPTSMGAIWTMHDSLRAQINGNPSLKAQHAHLSPTRYTASYVSNNHRKITQTRSAVIRPVWSGFSLCA